ncbi:hypothetical protein CHS0354_037226 [Potamilus streckersoni]|uniref:Uncharacterized protein n=1 Tax=Potamilus streckersoni TaxID=2493646 RepID=A0AAE0W433_9BIVA|nr:hypothetical protein CHS0354_037226 [Potamilus streckersoni]
MFYTTGDRGSAHSPVPKHLSTTYTCLNTFEARILYTRKGITAAIQVLATHVYVKQYSLNAPSKALVGVTMTTNIALKYYTTLLGVTLDHECRPKIFYGPMRSYTSYECRPKRF